MFWKPHGTNRISHRLSIIKKEWGDLIRSQTWEGDYSQKLEVIGDPVLAMADPTGIVPDHGVINMLLLGNCRLGAIVNAPWPIAAKLVRGRTDCLFDKWMRMSCQC